MRASAIAAAALLVGGAWLYWRSVQPTPYAPDASDAAPDWLDEANAMIYESRNAILPRPVSAMLPSSQLLHMLKQGEALRLQRYRLGDGGWTIGYGRYFPDGGPTPPESITRETAEAWFAEDVEARGARWVRAYVEVDLQQHEFDALVHIAFNLKPSSFKTVADAVNRGEDPEAAALQFIRAGSNLEKGLRNRRAKEIALYRQGVYA